MKLLMIGCGKMGGALLGGWLGKGGVDASIVDPGLTTPPEGATLLASVDDLDAGGDQAFDVIVIAIKPQMVTKLLPAYQGRLAPGGFFLSIVAGTARTTLEQLVQAPVMRVMPNLPAVIGKGITALCTDGVSDDQIGMAERLFAANGRTVRVAGESDIDRFTAVAGSGPGYIFEILRVYVDAAIDLGFDEGLARDLVFETVLGTTQMARDAESAAAGDLGTLRDNVTSKAGTTEAGLNQLRAGAELEARFKRTLQAAFARAEELSQQ